MINQLWSLVHESSVIYLRLLISLTFGPSGTFFVVDAKTNEKEDQQTRVGGQGHIGKAALTKICVRTMHAVHKS